ncbi:general stress protein [Cytobacillus massiliigabonensis]|uniref:general stress protein n=1 Tax=Cytobacillus massiliigabonensis TaxID=1871011 RepID=UPI000C81CD8F|nr:general stress protein [Cytobacillus massiliigabonensis]
MRKVLVATNAIEVQEKISQLVAEGYSKDQIYTFAHDKDYSKELTDDTSTQSVGLEEKGIVDTVANLFKSRGNELRSQFETLGLTQFEAEQYEAELDRGKIIIVASNEEFSTV